MPIISPYKFILVVLTINFQLSTRNSVAQLNYQQLTITDGLPANHINTLFQDSKGFIWLTSSAGFARYDGHRFKTFRYDYTKSNSIKGNAVKNLQEDAAGNIWVMQHAGLSKLNTSNWQVQNYFFADSATGKKYDWEVFAVHEENNKTLVASSKGLRQLDKKSNLLLPYAAYPLTDSINKYGASCFINYDANTLLIGTWQGLVLLNKQTGKYQRYLYPPKNEPGWPQPGVITSLHMDAQKQIWIGWWGGALTSFDVHTKQFAFFSPIINNQKLKWLVAADIEKGKETNTIYVTDRYQEAYSFNTQTLEWKIISPIILCNTNATFHGMLLDKAGTLWMGTSDGLLKADPNHQLFETHYLKIPTVPGADNGVLSIYKDEADKTGNSIWFAGYNAGNIFKYNLEQKKVLPLSSALKPLQNNLWEYYESFCRDNENNLWISSAKGIHVFNEKGNTLNLFESFKKNKTNLNSNGNIILKTKSKKIFAGGSHNLNVFDENTKTFKDIFFDTAYSNEVFDMNEDAKGNIWVARIDQYKKAAIISRVDAQNLTYKNYNNPVIQNCIYGTGKSLRCIYAKDDKHIYIGTSFGFFSGYLQNDSLVLKQASAADGFFAGQAEHIKPENDSIIWIHTSDGIYRHNMYKSTYSRIGTPNGMLNNFPNSINAYDGQLFLGYQDGNLQILNTNVLNNQKPPAVYITGFKVRGNDYLVNEKDILLQEEISITYKQDNIRFEFTALDYTNTNLQLFKYKLEGYDKDWVTTSEPFAMYNNLAGGHYTFTVKASNSFGNWNETGATVKLYVQPPFWKTNWFKVLTFFTLALLAWFIYKKRITAIQKEATLKQQRAEAEMIALRSQMNPHFIFNCLNTIDGFIVTNKPDEASELLQKFSKLIRMVLENSQQHTISIKQDWEMLQLYVALEKEVMENKFEYQFILDEKLQNNGYNIPSLLLQPFVENAILHGLWHRPDKNGLLSVTMQLQGNNIIACIEDNGVGRKQAEAINAKRQNFKSSIGIDIARKRLNEFDSMSTVYYEDADKLTGRGTKVRVTFAAQKN